MVGELTGARVLDLGCRQGDLTTHLLRSGADLTALDISPDMVDLVARRAERLAGPDARLTCLAAPFEQSGLPDGAFDFVLGR